LNDFYVYIYLDPRKHGKYKYDEYDFDYEPFYVGKGKGNRDRKINGRNNFFSKIINKIKKQKLNPIIIKLHKNLNESDSFILETKLIKLIGRRNINDGSLTNLTNGGDGISGYKFSNEIIRKKRKDFSYIEAEFKKNKYKLITKEKDYKNCNTKLNYICSNDHENSITWDNFKHGNRCSICHNELRSEKMNGKNSILIIQDVIQIKLLLKEGKLTQREIANIFGVNRVTITYIKNKKLWSYINI